jgi:hypothetical protein
LGKLASAPATLGGSHGSRASYLCSHGT